MNIDVSNLERSIEFYDKALGLKEVGHRIEAPDGSLYHCISWRGGEKTSRENQ
jgi:catechol 2,3-dioxygenase-like lactoylglutathione lyase family enzyme